MKNFKKNTFIILIITVIAMYIILKDDFNDIVHELLNMRVIFIVLSMLSFLIYLMCKAESLRIVAINNNKSFTYKKAFLQNLIVQFFNGITPFQTGGQPMQVYMLRKNNISVSKSTNIVIQEFIFYQIALVILGVIAVSINYFCHFFTRIDILRLLVGLGFLFNTLVVVALIIISLDKRITDFFVRGITKILIKLRIIKNKEKTLTKVDKKLKEFHSNAKYLLSNKKILIKGVIINFIGLCFFYITPLFVAYGFGISNINAIEVITASAYVYLVASFIPLPGATGGFEYSFMSFFGNFINGATLPAILIIFRTISYYIPIIIGGIIFNLYKGDEQK